MQATIGTSQPIVSESELNTIFYKIPELYHLHSTFLDALKRHLQKWDAKIGDHFKFMVRSITQVYFSVIYVLIKITSLMILILQLLCMSVSNLIENVLIF